MIVGRLLLALTFSIAGLLAGLVGQLGLCLMFYLFAGVIMVSLLNRAGGANPHLVEDTTKTYIGLVKSSRVGKGDNK